MKSVKETIIIRIIGRMDQLVFEVTKTSAKMLLNIKRVVQGSIFSDGNAFKVERGVTFNWEQTTSSNGTSNLSEEHANFADGSNACLHIHVTSIAFYKNKFPKLNTMLKEDTTRNLATMSLTLKLFKKSQQDFGNHSALGLHTDIVKDCTEKFEGSKHRTENEHNNLFYSCFGRRLTIIDYYFEWKPSVWRLQRSRESKDPGEVNNEMTQKIFHQYGHSNKCT